MGLGREHPAAWEGESWGGSNRKGLASQWNRGSEGSTWLLGPEEWAGMEKDIQGSREGNKEDLWNAAPGGELAGS